MVILRFFIPDLDQRVWVYLCRLHVAWHQVFKNLELLGDKFLVPFVGPRYELLLYFLLAQHPWKQPHLPVELKFLSLLLHIASFGHSLPLEKDIEWLKSLLKDKGQFLNVICEDEFVLIVVSLMKQVPVFYQVLDVLLRQHIFEVLE